MNVTLLYNYWCSDGTGLSHNSVTPVYWDTKGTDTRDTALASAVFTLCFILVGVPSNVLILVSILWQQLYREPTYILLLNLAAADLLVCVMFMPFTVVSGFAGGFTVGTTDSMRCSVCQFIGLQFVFFGYLTVHILALLSLDRFLFIKYPLKYFKLVTCRKTSLACLCVWILCLLLSLPPLFSFGDFVFSLRVSSCVINIELRARNLYYGILVALEVCIPLTVLFVTNIWVLCIIRKQMRKLYSTKRKRHETVIVFRDKVKTTLKNSKYVKQLQLIKVFGGMWIANIITWTPFFIHIIGTAIFQSLTSKWFSLYVFINIISYAVIYPIIEASLIPEMRKHLCVLVKKLTCWRQNWDSTSSQGKRYCGSTCSAPSCTNSCSLHCLDLVSVTVIPINEELSSPPEL